MKGNVIVGQVREAQQQLSFQSCRSVQNSRSGHVGQKRFMVGCTGSRGHG